MNRREFVTRCTASMGLLMMASTPAEAAAPLRMPAEWEPHARCFLCWSAAHGVYTKAEIKQIHQEQARLARLIASFEPVTMLARPSDVDQARKQCGATVNVLSMAVFDIWSRDTLPSFAIAPGGRPGGKIAAVGWNFNVWGEKFAGYDADRLLAGRLATHLGLEFVPAGLIGEGGAIDTNGAGTLLTTQTCLLNANRNSGLTMGELDAELKRLTGARKVIWLPGSKADTVTDGHVDGIARFVATRTVVAEVSDDPYDPEYADLMRNAETLEKASDADGRPLEVLRLKRPRADRIGPHGNDFAASYVNCYIANGGVIMPKFGDAARDSAAADLFRRCFPNRNVVQIFVDGICEGGGGIHCNTQQLPQT